ncbi:hypothetical protein BDZ94DRAFT_1254548 [Collybia nuda]|uniref:Oxidase ustYa n=1 Tax=Collybia nuda TaxID=64659 RepID=A0A9P5YAJ4_9AGAR|nr:hypothetical protein BDZ94DRAFT_1254548 [Collybia nuda]
MEAKTRTTLISVSLLSLSLLNLIFIWNSWRGTSPDPYTYRGHDFPETLPLPSPLQEVLLTVEESSRYALKGKQSDDEWFSLASASYGYVHLGPHNRVFVVTMFHQLHCLRMLNLGFNPMEAIGDAHLQHCLSYLRQMILCDPDLTLEPAGWETRDFEGQRIGATHVCQDWSTVYDVVDENYQGWNRTE